MIKSIIWGLNLSVGVYFLISLLMANSVFASSVSNVKGTQAVIDLEGASANPGMQMYSVDAKGKKVGLMEVKQVKNGKALAIIKKGKVEKGQSVITAGASGKKSGAAASEEAADSSVQRKSKWSVGGILGYSMDTMTLTAKDLTATISENLTLTGTSISEKAFAYYELSPSFTFRGVLGLEGFTGAATAKSAGGVCNNGGVATTSCAVSFKYFSMEGHGQWNFYNKSNVKIWVSGGYAFLMASSTTNNVTNLDTSTKTNSVILLGAGSDIGVGKTGFIPVMFEYGYYPASGGVSATSMYLRAGYGARF